MSFLNKIKGWGHGAEADAANADKAPVTEAAAVGDPHAGSDSPAADTTDAALHGVPTVQQAADLDTSIISEAAPSEMADFAETRLPEGDAMASAAAGAGLPVIGQRPVAEQQRILAFMVGLGVAGLILMTVLSLLSANRGAHRWAPAARR